MKRSLAMQISIFCLVLCCAVFSASAEENGTAASAAPAELNLADAVMCESIENFKPVHPSAVFSVTGGSVMCFTGFDVVPKTMDVFHDWIKKDTPVYRKKLVLKPPRWSTVSSIKLRESDKGPWRVEVRDSDGKLLSTLRFSITE